MIDRCCNYSHTIEFALFPPVKFKHVMGTSFAHPLPQAERHTEQGIFAALPLCQALNCLFVKRIKVIMGDEHYIDDRQFSQGDAWGDNPLRTGPLHWRGTVGENRIGEDVPAFQLQEEGGVTDPGNGILEAVMLQKVGVVLRQGKIIGLRVWNILTNSVNPPFMGNTAGGQTKNEKN